MELADQAFMAPAPLMQTCSRCGNFGELHDYWGAHYCEACLARRLPIEREPWSIGGLLGGVAFLLRAIGLKAAALLTLFSIPSAIFDLWELPLAVSMLYGGLVMIMATAAIQRMAFAHVTGLTPVSLTAALGRARARWGALVGANIISGMLVGLFTLLLIVPGVLKLLSYALVTTIVINEDGGNALERSTQRMAGHRGKFFGAALLFGVAYVGTVIFVSTAMVLAFGAGSVEGPLFKSLVSLVTPVTLLPLYLLSAVAHLKLGRAGEPAF